MTNFKTIKQSVKRMLELEEMFASGAEERLSKKEALTLRRELEKLEKSLGGVKSMDHLPDALFVIDTGYEKIAIAEARKLGIPIIAVVDSNNSPSMVDYVIPGNDDAVRAIQLYVDAAAEAIQAGKTAAAISDSKEYVEVKNESDQQAAAASSAEEAAAEAEASLAAAAEATTEATTTETTTSKSAAEPAAADSSADASSADPETPAKP